MQCHRARYHDGMSCLLACARHRPHGTFGPEFGKGRWIRKERQVPSEKEIPKGEIEAPRFPNSSNLGTADPKFPKTQNTKVLHSSLQHRAQAKPCPNVQRTQRAPRDPMQPMGGGSWKCSAASQPGDSTDTSKKCPKVGNRLFLLIPCGAV